VLGRALGIAGSEESSKHLRRSFVDVGVRGRLLPRLVHGLSYRQNIASIDLFVFRGVSEVTEACPKNN
jgi:hypothetical protein